MNNTKNSNNIMFNFAIGLFLIFALLAFISMFEFFDWNKKVGNSYETPSLKHLFGTDIFGRSVFRKIIKGIQISLSLGLLASGITLLLGVGLGLLSGYFGGIIDKIVTYIYTIIGSVPDIILLMAMSYILGKGFLPMCIAFIFTKWVGICRIIRQETIKQKHLQYVMAVKVLGAGNGRIIFSNILPNIKNIILIQSGILFQISIKSEVFLSFLGLGIQDSYSWGTMIFNAKSELIKGIWWPITFITIFMFLLFLCLNIINETLKKRFSPYKVA